MTQTFRSRLDEAVKMKQARKLDLAWDAFAELARENPRSAYFWSNYAHLALMLKRLPEARHFAEHALSIDSSNRFCRSLYADILLRQNEVNTALNIIREIMEEKPDLILIKKLVKAAARRKALPELEQYIREWLHRYRDDFELLSIAAEYYNKIGDKEKAIEYYQQIVNQGKANDFAYERLIALKTRGKSADEKIKQLETIVKMPSQKDNVHLLGLLAQEYKKNEEWGRAEQIYRRIVKLAPDDLFQKKQMGFLYAKKGDLDRAIEILSDCLLTDPDDTYVRSALFSALQKTNSKDFAFRLIEQILLRYPDKKQYFGWRKKVEKW